VTNPPSPTKRSKVSVIGTAGVVPIDAERMHLATSRVRQSKAGADRMWHVLEVHRLSRHGPSHRFERLIQHLRDRRTALERVLVELDWSCFNTGERTDTDRSRTRHPPRCVSACTSTYRVASASPITRSRRSRRLARAREGSRGSTSCWVRATVERECGVRLDFRWGTRDCG
jgi:hypothetical protein